MKTLINLIVLISLFITPSTLLAYSNLPPDNSTAPFPDIVHLRTDCAAENPDLKNCADNVEEMLYWIWNTRTTTNSLIVDVGPGIWVVPNDKPFCPSNTPANENVTFRGSGRSSSIFTGGGFSLASAPNVKSVLSFDNCRDISFQDLGIQSDYRRNVTGSIDGIHWHGSEGSTWTNIEVQANHYGWVDTGCGAGPAGIHYWFGSKVESRTGPAVNSSAFGFYPFCAVTNFYGGQIVGLHDKPYASNGVAAVAVNGLGLDQAIFSIYGGSVHATTAEDAGPVGFWAVTGLLAYNTGEVHMHGGSITVEAKNDANNQNVFGVWAIQQAHGHALDTAFIVRPSGTGNAYRILDTVPGNDVPELRGVVDAPFVWPAGTQPPTPGDPTGAKHIVSTRGNDLFVETDCATTGCQTVGGEPHMLIYSDACSGAGGPWFDVVTGACR